MGGFTSHTDEDTGALHKTLKTVNLKQKHRKYKLSKEAGNLYVTLRMREYFWNSDQVEHCSLRAVTWKVSGLL